MNTVSNDTKMTYRDAALALNTNIGTVRAAASRGMFTRLPMPGVEQYLLAKQVMLFKGKKQLRISQLSPDELMQWQECRKQAENSAPAQGNGTYSSEEVASLLASYERQRGGMTDEQKKTSSPDYSELINSVMQDSSNAFAVLAIALLVFGLLWLLYEAGKRKVDTEEIEEIKEQYTDNPQVIDIADKIYKQVHTPNDAIPLILDEVERIVA